MDWTNDVVLRFLELYQKHPCIWDPKIASHKNKTKVLDAWCDIKNDLQFPGTIKELKKKRESLMSAYRGYKIKIKRSEKSGAGVSDLYKPTWFAFELMDSFLASVYTCKQSVQSEPIQDTEIVCDTLCHDPLRSENEAHRVKHINIDVSRNLTPPEKPATRKRKHHETDNDNSSGNKKVEKMFQDDDLTAFGNYIVSTLRKFNARNCVEAQSEIFEVLSRYKLRQLENSEATYSGALLSPTELTAKTESPCSGDEDDGW